MVKLFRIAKRFVKNIFNPETDGEEVAPVELGALPVAAPVVPDNKAESVPEKIRDATENVKPDIHTAMDQIMANAKPVSAEGFSDADHNSEDDTMIAVVTDTTTGVSTVIPGVENLKNQMRHATKAGNAKGLDNFLARLAPVIEKRGHSVQELLNFMSRGDLPIADDGCIIGYKVLRSTPKDSSSYGAPVLIKDVPLNYFVDCHSGNVLQRVGSLVQQEKVDPSRRTQCSTGLHIARRAYLRGFSGDIICLVKIAPEDVIAVPENEPDKMRARAYHIINVIPAAEHQRLRNNEPIEGMEAKRMLGMAIAGDHVGIVEDVIISGTYGTGLKVVQRDGQIKQTPKITEAAPIAEALSDPEKKDGAAPVDAKAIDKAVTETKLAPQPVREEVKPGGGLVNPAPVSTAGITDETPQRKLFREGQFAELIALKKAKKKSYSALGFNEEEENEILANLVQNTGKVEPDAPKAEPVKRDVSSLKAVDTKLMAETGEVKMTPVKETRGEKALRLFKAGDWAGLYAHKKAIKVGFSNMGVFNAKDLERILNNDPNKK